MYQGLFRTQLTARFAKKELLEYRSAVHPVFCVKLSICIGFNSDQHKAHQLLTLLHKVKVMCDAGRDAMGPQPQLPLSNTCPAQTHVQYVDNCCLMYQWILLRFLCLEIFCKISKGLRFNIHISPNFWPLSKVNHVLASFGLGQAYFFVNAISTSLSSELNHVHFFLTMNGECGKRFQQRCSQAIVRYWRLRFSAVIAW